jgi:hypothetical protein
VSVCLSAKASFKPCPLATVLCDPAPGASCYSHVVFPSLLGPPLLSFSLSRIPLGDPFVVLVCAPDDVSRPFEPFNLGGDFLEFRLTPYLSVSPPVGFPDAEHAPFYGALRTWQFGDCSFCQGPGFLTLVQGGCMC